MTNRSQSSKHSLLIMLVMLGVLVSVVSFVIYAQQGYLTTYPDAQAHLLIARRVCDSSSPGLAQLGAVWLPATHILSLPLICADVLSQTPGGHILLTGILCFMWSLSIWIMSRFVLTQFRTITKIIVFSLTILVFVTLWFALPTKYFYTQGVAQTIISMVCYNLMGVFVFQFVSELTRQKAAGAVAWLALMINPNMIYLQTTAMTEIPLYCGIIASLYTFWKLSHEPSSQWWIFCNGVANLLMTTTRYEGWYIVGLEAAVYGLILLTRRHKFSALLGHLTMWGMLSFAGVLGWLLWNLTIFGTPFEFQTGVYAKPSNWVAGTEASLRSLEKAFLTYVWGIWNTIGPIAFVGGIGSVGYVLYHRFRPRALAPILPLALLPFFVFMLYKGQRPMQSIEVEGSLYNARFALVMLTSIAISVGYLTQGRIWRKYLGVAVIAASNLFLITNSGTITLTEPLLAENSRLNAAQSEVTEWVRNNYQGESVLMESYGNESIQFNSGINLSQVVYEGTYRGWETMLAEPFENDIAWVIMRGTTDSQANNLIASLTADKVWETQQHNPKFHSGYELVFSNEIYQIYTRRPESLPLVLGSQ